MDLRELNLGEGDAAERLSLPELLTLHPVSSSGREPADADSDDSDGDGGERGPAPGLFEGPSTSNTGSRVFGGLVLGQVVAAAALTLPDGYPVHHLSGQFAGPADGRAPLRFHVKHVRDGRAFAIRTVEAIQHGRVVFAGLVSGHVGGEGIDHQVPRLEGPGPEESPNGDAWYAPWPDHVRYTQRLELELGLELRFPSPPVHVAALRGEPTEPRQSVWVRSAVPLPDLPDGRPDPVLQAAAFAYISDLLLLGSALGPHRRTMFDPEVQVATINHALGLHAPVRVDDWIRVDQSAPWSGNGVAMCRSELFSPDGRLVGSVGQESVVRILS